MWSHQLLDLRLCSHPPADLRIRSHQLPDLPMFSHQPADPYTNINIHTMYECENLWCNENKSICTSFTKKSCWQVPSLFWVGGRAGGWEIDSQTETNLQAHKSRQFAVFLEPMAECAVSLYSDTLSSSANIARSIGGVLEGSLHLTQTSC